MKKHYIAYGDVGFRVSIEADTIGLFLDIKEAVRESLEKFDVTEIIGKERTVRIGERTEVGKAQGKEST